MLVYVLKDAYFHVIYGVFSTPEAAEKKVLDAADYCEGEKTFERQGNDEEYDFTVQVKRDGEITYSQKYTIEAFELQ